MSERSQNPESMGVDPVLKEQINKEGWEVGKDYNSNTKEETEGGGAVYVGREDEMPNLAEHLETKSKTESENLENESRAENLLEYLQAHSAVLIKQNELPRSPYRLLPKSKAWFGRLNTQNGLESKYNITYVNEDGDLCAVEFKVGDIDSLYKPIREKLGEAIDGEGKYVGKNDNAAGDIQKEVIKAELKNAGFTDAVYPNDPQYFKDRENFSAIRRFI
ncbi:MAG: hypothetical protein V1770_01825 [bacterium]